MRLTRRLLGLLHRSDPRAAAPLPASPPASLPASPPASRRPSDRSAGPGAYRLADPTLGRLQPSDLDPRLRTADLADLATPLAPDLWALPLLTNQACARLVAELDAIDAWCARHHVVPQRPNTMNHYGIILADFGLDAFVTDLRAQVIAPLATRLFTDCGGASLDSHHAFIVDYSDSGDRDLGFHVDDADVTLNLCLADGFSAGDLYFEGRRCLHHVDTPARPEERVTLAHRPGVALLHAGKHRHGALPIGSGRRRNLIVWSRSSAWSAQEAAWYQEGRCPDWCGG